MQIIIDGYGEPTPFDSIKEAQSELRSNEIVGFVQEFPIKEGTTHGK